MDMRYLINLVEGRGWHDEMMRDFQSGELSPDEFAAKWDESNKLYLYHGTSAANLESIRAHGLVPHKIADWMDAEPVWFAKDPETSDFYKGSGGVLLRVLKSNVKIAGDSGGSTCNTFTPIAPEFLEIEQADGSWEPL